MANDKYTVVCIGFINGTTMIGKLENNTFSDAFFITLVRNPESKEKTFCFKPVLPCAAEQHLDAGVLAALLNGDAALKMYAPASSVEAAYRMFTDNEELMGKVIYDHLYECGPSKEFVDSLFKDMPKPERKTTCENGVIKGAFGPTFRMICDDEEGQS